MPETITVACKIPTGLKLRLHRLEDRTEMTMAGGFRDTKVAVLMSDKTVTLAGPARYVGIDTSKEIRHGAGITHGVDAEFFAEWMRQNADSDVVRKGLVFAQVKSGSIEAQAREHAFERTGLEPADPKRLPPEFKGKIETSVAA